MRPAGAATARLPRAGPPHRSGAFDASHLRRANDGGAEPGGEQERDEPESQVNRSLSRTLAQSEDGGVVPAVWEIRLERVTVEGVVPWADRSHVDGDEARVRTHEVVREGELDHGVADLPVRCAGPALVEKGSDLPARPVHGQSHALVGVLERQRVFPLIQTEVTAK